MLMASNFNYRSGDFASEDSIVQAFTRTLPLNLQGPIHEPVNSLFGAVKAFQSGVERTAIASAAIRSVRTNSPTRDLSAYSPTVAAASLAFAFNDFKKAYPHLIKQLFDRTQKPQDRILAHSQICNLFDSSYNALRKYQEVTGLRFDDEIRAFEKYRSDFRSVVVQEFEQCYTEDYFSILMLNEIDGSNDEKGISQEEFEDLADLTTLGGDYLQGPANNRTENCTRTSLTTMAAMLGSKSQAPAGYDDVELDKYLRIAHHEVFQKMSYVPWQDGGSLDATFAMLQYSEENSFNFLRYGYKDKYVGHITVGANINGRPCIIEGQTNSIITQNRDGSFLRAQGEMVDGRMRMTYSKFDASHIVHPIFLVIQRNDYGTEFDRASLVMKKLYERAEQLRQMERKTEVVLEQPKWRDDPKPLPSEFKPGLEDDPGDHLQMNPAPVEPIIEPKVRGLFD